MIGGASVGAVAPRRFLEVCRIEDVQPCFTVDVEADFGRLDGRVSNLFGLLLHYALLVWVPGVSDLDVSLNAFLGNFLNLLLNLCNDWTVVIRDADDGKNAEADADEANAKENCGKHLPVIPEQVFKTLAECIICLKTHTKDGIFGIRTHQQPIAFRRAQRLDLVGGENKSGHF